MTDKPSISIRKYIKWGDNPPSENTDTLVLTTPHHFFTDVRLYLPTSTTELNPSSNTPSIQLPKERLEWAFAGTSSSTPAITSTTQSDSKPAHTIWKHWVDSQTVEAEEVTDEGDMFPQSNGEMLEYGTMVNPDTGREEGYVECWVDLEVGEGKGWVLRTEGGGARGMVVKIGTWIQGVIRRGGEVGVGRWRWKDGGWERVMELGELDIPGVVFEGEVKEGEKFVGSDSLVWECVETFRWS